MVVSSWRSVGGSQAGDDTLSNTPLYILQATDYSQLGSYSSLHYIQYLVGTRVSFERAWGNARPIVLNSEKLSDAKRYVFRSLSVVFTTVLAEGRYFFVPESVGCMYCGTSKYAYMWACCPIYMQNDFPLNLGGEARIYCVPFLVCACRCLLLFYSLSILDWSCIHWFRGRRRRTD